MAKGAEHINMNTDDQYKINVKKPGIAGLGPARAWFKNFKNWQDHFRKL